MISQIKIGILDGKFMPLPFNLEQKDYYMKGIIEFIDFNQALIAVRTEHDEFSLIELLGGYSPEIGDNLSGNLENLGGETLNNITQNEKWDVFIQDVHTSKKIASQMIYKH
ncbi:hypothetical protein LLG96_04265 [bacterium]|nr:hypothetical protein [bacterium]